MSSEVEVFGTLAAHILDMAFVVLAGVVGFRLGRAEGSRVYRTRAFWMAVSSVVFVFLVISALLFDPINIYTNHFNPSWCCWGYSRDNPALYYAALLSPYLVNQVAAIVFFAFAYSTIRIAVEQDFLHRNILGWNKTRKLVLAIIIGAGLVQFVAFAVFGSFVQNPTLIGTQTFTVNSTTISSRISSSLAPPAVTILLAVVLGSVVYMTAVLITASIRTPDQIIKKHVIWLAFATVAVLVELLAGYLPPYSGVIGGLAAAFCWYRAARSLSPTAKRTMEPGQPLGGAAVELGTSKSA